MKIIKVLGNNSVVVLVEDGREGVAFGKGIGFGQKIDNLIQENKIEKLYLFQDDLQTKFLKLLKDIDEKYIFVTEAIIKAAKEKGLSVPDKAIIPMSDHISFAVSRSENDTPNVNIMLNEVKMFYPEEYKVGEYGVELINSTFNVSLPPDEAAYLAMHIVQAANAQTPESTKKVITFVKDCTEFISDFYGITFKEDDFNYFRLVNHLKFFVGRILEDKVINFNENDGMYAYIMSAHPKNKDFVKKFKEYIRELFDHEVSNSEILYILIHITKFCENKTGGEKNESY